MKPERIEQFARLLEDSLRVPYSTHRPGLTIEQSRIRRIGEVLGRVAREAAAEARAAGFREGIEEEAR